MRATKRQRISGPTVAVKVGTGDQMENYTIHETLLRQSKFFDATLRNEWKEATTRVIRLPEDQPDIAQVYFDWIYSGEVASRDSGDPLDKTAHANEGNLLAKLYVFGEKIQDDAFCDALIAAMVELFATKIGGKPFYHTANFVRIIYGGTPVGSPARKLAADMTANFGHASWMKTDYHATIEFPEYAIDVATTLFENRSPLSIQSQENFFAKPEQWFKKAVDK